MVTATKISGDLFISGHVTQGNVSCNLCCNKNKIETSCQTTVKLPGTTVPLLKKDARVSLIMLVSKESVYVPTKLTNYWCCLFHF